MPGAVDIKGLPHANGIPILRQGTDSLGHMRGAAESAARKFYHFRPEKMYPLVLVNPTHEVPRSIPDGRERDKVEGKFKSYEVARKRFGAELAGVIWGAPILPTERLEESRVKGPSLERYQRFLTTTHRDQMVNALQMDGRFRLYIPSADGVKAFKIKVKNPRARGRTPLDVGVDAFSWTERAQESLMGLFGKVTLPV